MYLHHQAALILSLIAGFSTFIGGFVVILIGKPSDNKIGIMTGFASGVMLFVSLFHLVPETYEEIGYFSTFSSFLIGCLLFHLLTHYVLTDEFILEQASLNATSSSSTSSANSSVEERKSVGGASSAVNKRRLLVTAIIVTIGLSLHNLPEGMAVYLSTLMQYKLGLMMALAIGMHNIPEGFVVSITVYAATGSKYQSLKYALLSGLCEPLGALLFGIILYFELVPVYFVYYLLGACGGVMSYICFSELIPTSYNYLGKNWIKVLISNFIGVIVIYVCSFWLEMYELDE